MKELDENFDKDYPEDGEEFVGNMYDIYKKGFEAGRRVTLIVLPSHVIKRIKYSIKSAKEAGEDMDSISWGHQEGILISCNEAKEILKSTKNPKVYNS